jgi:hypothetical protein
MLLWLQQASLDAGPAADSSKHTTRYLQVGELWLPSTVTLNDVPASTVLPLSPAVSNAAAIAHQHCNSVLE